MLSPFWQFVIEVLWLVGIAVTLWTVTVLVVLAWGSVRMTTATKTRQFRIDYVFVSVRSDAIPGDPAGEGGSLTVRLPVGLYPLAYPQMLHHALADHLKVMTFFRGGGASISRQRTGGSWQGQRLLGRPRVSRVR